MPDPTWLPTLVKLDDHDGEWCRYEDAVYAVFRRDFIESRVVFRSDSVRIGAQRIDEKERTFWHVTSEGNVESNRTPDLRRCERIGWVRAIIDHECDPAVLSWPEVRGRNFRHVLWLKDRLFAVILEKRPGCWWLWTAYPTDRRHTREKLMRDYEAWKKANAAPSAGTASGLLPPMADEL